MKNTLDRNEKNMTPEEIAILIASLLLFIVGIKLGEERAKGEEEIE